MNLKHTKLTLITFLMSSTTFCQVNILEVDGVIKISNIDTLTPAEGTLRYNTDDNTFEGWNGLYWVQLGKPLGEISDFDGNTYHTVQIGTQEWMAENLRVEHFNYGSPISEIVDGTTWSETVNPAWCYYQNDTSMDKIHGKLYNFYAAQNGLCPVGWLVPSGTDWNILSAYLGNEAGGTLKAVSNSNWISPNTGATNESGFTAVASGYRQNIGAFVNLGKRAFYWTRNDYDIALAWVRGLSFTNADLVQNRFSKNYGLSIRCVKY